MFENENLPDKRRRLDNLEKFKSNFKIGNQYHASVGVSLIVKLPFFFSHNRSPLFAKSRRHAKIVVLQLDPFKFKSLIGHGPKESSHQN